MLVLVGHGGACSEETDRSVVRYDGYRERCPEQSESYALVNSRTSLQRVLTCRRISSCGAVHQKLTVVAGRALQTGRLQTGRPVVSKQRHCHTVIRIDGPRQRATDMSMKDWIEVRPRPPLSSLTAWGLVLIVLMIGTGCTTTKTVHIDDTSGVGEGARPVSAFQEMKERTERRKADVRLRNGIEVSGRLTWVSADSVRIGSLDEVVPLHNVERVKVRANALRGAAETGGLTAAVALGTGFLIGYASFDGPDFVFSSAEEAGALVAVAFAAIAAPVGLVIGAIRRHVYVYRIQSRTSIPEAAVESPR